MTLARRNAPTCQHHTAALQMSTLAVNQPTRVLVLASLHANLLICIDALQTITVRSSVMAA